MGTTIPTFSVSSAPENTAEMYAFSNGTKKKLYTGSLSHKVMAISFWKTFKFLLFTKIVNKNKMTEVSGTKSWMEYLPLSLLVQKKAEYWVWVTISKINECNCSYWSKYSYLLEQISRAPSSCHAVNNWVVFYFIAIRINKRVFIFLPGRDESIPLPSCLKVPLTFWFWTAL